MTGGRGSTRRRLQSAGLVGIVAVLISCAPRYLVLRPTDPVALLRERVAVETMRRVKDQDTLSFLIRVQPSPGDTIRLLLTPTDSASIREAGFVPPAGGMRPVVQILPGASPGRIDALLEAPADSLRVAGIATPTFCFGDAARCVVASRDTMVDVRVPVRGLGPDRFGVRLHWYTARSGEGFAARNVLAAQADSSQLLYGQIRSVPLGLTLAAGAALGAAFLLATTR